MYWTIAGLLIAVLAAAPAGAAGWITNSFRTATGGLVQLGDTVAEVLHSAGEPLAQRIISAGVTIGDPAGLTRERWIYRTSDGTYVVTFAGDTVEQIEVVPQR